MRRFNLAIVAVALVGTLGVTGCVSERDTRNAESASPMVVSASDADRYEQAAAGKVLKDGKWVIDVPAAQAYRTSYETRQANTRTNSNSGVAELTAQKNESTAGNSGVGRLDRARGLAFISFVTGASNGNNGHPGFVLWTALHEEINRRGLDQSVVVPLLRDGVTYFRSRMNQDRVHCAGMISNIEGLLRCANDGQTQAFLDRCSVYGAQRNVTGGVGALPCPKGAAGAKKPAGK
jgi:hypothetical protein